MDLLPVMEAEMRGKIGVRIDGMIFVSPPLITPDSTYIKRMLR